jgi:hypothetical protein
MLMLQGLAQNATVQKGFRQYTCRTKMLSICVVVFEMKSLRFNLQGIDIRGESKIVDGNGAVYFRRKIASLSMMLLLNVGDQFIVCFDKSQMVWIIAIGIEVTVGLILVNSILRVAHMGFGIKQNCDYVR